MCIKKNKGFTLIELLATILLVAILLSVMGYFVISSITNAKDKTSKLTLSNIYMAAKDYTTEFYRSDNFWVDASSEFEYTCVDIKSLIEQGYFKNNLLDDNITKETIIKVERNKKSKTISPPTIVEKSDTSKVCSMFGEAPDITITLEGTKGINDKWYISNLSYSIKTENVSDESSFYYNYNITDLKNKKKIVNKNNISPNIETTGNITSEGKYKICAYSYNKIGSNSKNECIEAYVDLNAPLVNTIIFVNNEINITAKNNNDDIYYSINEKDYFKNNLFKPSTSSDLFVYAKEESGRKSDNVKKKITIEDYKNMPVLKKYYCDYTKQYYDTESSAKTACTYQTTRYYNSPKFYYCSINQQYYSDFNSAYNNCYITGKRCVKCDFTSDYKYEYRHNDSYCTYYIETTKKYDSSNKCISGSVEVLQKIVSDNDYWFSTIYDITRTDINLCNDFMTSCNAGFTRDDNVIMDENMVNGYIVREWRASCEKNGDVWYMFNYDGACSDNAGTYYEASKLYTNPSTKYKCDNSNSYTNYQTTCSTLETKNSTVSGKYYCNYTNKYYSTEADATLNCKGCNNENAELYNKKCYLIEE